RKGREERAAARQAKFLEGHAGNRKVRIEVGSNWISHQRVDAAECRRRIRTVQRPERGTALECDECSDLPASEQAAECTRLSAIERQFVNGVCRESLWSIISGARAIRVPIEGILCDGNFSPDGSIERIRRCVNERTPGVMRAGT